MLNIKNLAVIAALLNDSRASENNYLTIDESVRFSDGVAGMAFTVSSFAADYLKTLYLPHLYDKIHTFSLPVEEFDVDHFKGTIQTEVTFPEPEQTFIKNWETSFVSKNNSLKI